jgi:hypothetical protein
MRKTMLAIATSVVLATSTLATGAMAAPHGHFGGHFGGFHGGPGFGLYSYSPGYYDGCWQRRLVPTPYGLRWRLVNVCY